MKVSKNWLNEYVDLSDISDEELFQKISTHVCEIEAYKKFIEATNLTIGYVKECSMHPNSDHLHICQVEVRPGQIEQIVCGAPNVAAGKKVIVANVGASLPGDFKIKASKIRGVESNGMLCSLQELGIEEKYVPDEFKNGIYLFADDALVGADPLEYLGFNDTVIDLDLTSNRSDLLSVEGVAYDVAAALAKPIITLIPELKEESKKNQVKVDIESKDCYKYLARVIEGVKIEESPQWLKARLIVSGIRPINNVVDVTNYVLLEMGQPLHAFDKDRLGEHIIVRNAKAKEELVTLDGIKRILEPTDLVIANDQEVLCLAGVMGGLSSEVENDTTNIVLEAAYFDPLCIRKTSSRLSLKSESSIRFERNIDYERVEKALDYAAQLINEIAGGKALSGVSKAVTKELACKNVSITTEKINQILGTELVDEAVEDIFKRLNYSYTKNASVYNITIPSRRMDLEESYQDIVEDVARMNGYDNIPTTIATINQKGGLTTKQKKLRSTRQIWSDMGLNEVVTYSLIAEKDLNLYTNATEAIRVLMPLTEDRALMRQSLLNGVIEAIAYNKARKVDNLAFFEIGKTYTTSKETNKLAGAITGLFSSILWQGAKQGADFYVLKGLLDVYFEKMNVKVEYKPYKELANFHPGRTAGIYLGEKLLGVVGELHPRLVKELGISQTIAFEIELDPILDNSLEFVYKPLNKFPAVTRDLAIVVKKEVLAEDVLSLIRKSGKEYLVNLELFDLYTGENVGEDEKSIAIKLTLQDPNKTLESDEIDKIVNSILRRLEYTLNARLRD